MRIFNREFLIEMAMNYAPAELMSWQEVWL